MDHVITEKKETETTHSGSEPSSRLDEDNPEKRVCLQQVSMDGGIFCRKHVYYFFCLVERLVGSCC